MADIAAFLNKIRTAIYGEEVRSSIADAIEAVNEEGTSGGGGSSGGGGGGSGYEELSKTTIYSNLDSGASVALWKRSGIAFMELVQLPVTVSVSDTVTFTIPNTASYFPGITNPITFYDVLLSGTVAVSGTGWGEQRAATLPATVTIKPAAIEIAVVFSHMYTDGAKSTLSGFVSFPDPTATPSSGPSTNWETVWTVDQQDGWESTMLSTGRVDIAAVPGTLFVRISGGGFIFNANRNCLIEISGLSSTYGIMSEHITYSSGAIVLRKTGVVTTGEVSISLNPASGGSDVLQITLTGYVTELVSATDMRASGTFAIPLV